MNKEQNIPSRIYIKNGNIISVSGVTDIVDIVDKVTDLENNWFNKTLQEEVVIIMIDEGKPSFLEYDDFGLISIPRKEGTENEYHDFFWNKDLVMLFPNYEKACDYLINFYGGEFEVILRDLGKHMLEQEIKESANARQEDLERGGLLFNNVLLSLFQLNNYPPEAQQKLMIQISSNACLIIEQYKRDNSFI